MNSSARTLLFSSISTRSMAMVGTSARTTRRREFASERSTCARLKLTWSLSAWHHNRVRFRQNCHCPCTWIRKVRLTSVILISMSFDMSTSIIMASLP